MDEIVAYIIEFLLYGNKEAAQQVGYTSDPTKCSRYKVCIQPNGHLGKDWVLPDLSAEGGLTAQRSFSPKDGPVVFTTDIIYNTAFFISRAEELINPQRDEHGRFLAHYSMLGQNDRLSIPLIDEYSRVLMKALDLPLPAPGLATINLTHDIDILTQYRHLRGAAGGFLRGRAQEVLTAWRDIHRDPAYTFEWLMEQDLKVLKHHPQTRMIYFVKHTPGKGYDYPQYNLRGKDFQNLAHYLSKHGALLGWHSSYYELSTKKQLSTKKLDDFFQLSIQRLAADRLRLAEIRTFNFQLNRSHFLNCSIEKMRTLAAAGITDDYTMGFADKAGFRLQTTRPVKWLDPVTFELTNLILHPLTVMDTTLTSEQYMHLDEEQAFFYCRQLIDRVKQYNGELTLLWHNTNVKTAYLGVLYATLLETL